MNIYIETYGCTFNQADSQIMAGLLTQKDAEIVGRADDAEVIILNTCYVKHPTEKKMINRIQRIQKNYPHKRLIVAGCMVEIDPDMLEKIAPQSCWIGPHQIKSIPYMAKWILNEDKGMNVRITGPDKIDKVCLPKIRPSPLIHTVQICEGCNGNCSYCCTRFARGSLQSYSSDLIRKEVDKAVFEGCVEIQLTAQDTAAYGKDTDEKLSNLINKITSIEGDFRVRVGMMHPKSLLDDVDEIIRSFQHEKVYNFLHLPLQSGNNTVLNDMNRGHNLQQFKEIVSKFSQKIPELSLATDIIVGYPTENSYAFNDTIKVIEEIKPDFLHISKYHHRPGTPASSLKEIDHQTLKKRTKYLNELKSKITYKKNTGLLKTNQNVLITEKGSKGGFIGRNDSYKTVVIDEAFLGSFVDVKITEVKSTYMMGRVI